MIEESRVFAGDDKEEICDFEVVNERRMRNAEQKLLNSQSSNGSQKPLKETVIVFN